MASSIMSTARFRVFVGAKFLSDCGSAMDLVILTTYVLVVSQDSLAVGLFLTARLGATVLGSAVASRWADRWPRRGILIGADLGRAATLAALALSPASAHPWLLIVVGCLLGFGNGLYKVALYAEAPALRGFDRRFEVNSAFSATEGVAQVVGGLSAALVLSVVSYAGVFMMDATSYLISATALVLLTRGVQTARVAPGDSAAAVPALSLRTLLRTISVALPLAFLARAVEAFGSSAHNIGWPIFSAGYDADNPAFLFGSIIAAWGSGRLLAAAFAPRLLTHRTVADDPSGLERVFLLGVILTFVMFIGVFATYVYLLVLVFAVAAGVFDALTEIAYYSSLQRAPDAQRGKIVGASYALERIGMGAGMLVTSAALEVLPLFETILALYGVSILIATLMLIALGRLPRAPATEKP